MGIKKALSLYNATIEISGVYRLVSVTWLMK